MNSKQDFCRAEIIEALSSEETVCPVVDPNFEDVFKVAKKLPPLLSGILLSRSTYAGTGKDSYDAVQQQYYNNLIF